MALRSPALYMGNPAINHTAQNDRLSKAGLLRPETGQTASSRPLTAASGVLAGPAGTMGEVTLLSNTQFTVNPARWYLMSTDTPLGGAYEVTNDAVETIAITAQDATQFRKAYFGVWVIDSFVAGSGDDLPHWGLVNGALAASNPQLPAAGALPENFLALGEFLIPPTGQSVTWTAYNLTTGLRGGIVPVSATDTRNGSHDWSLRAHPVLGLQRWNATAAAWQAVKSITADWLNLNLNTTFWTPQTVNGMVASNYTPTASGIQVRREGDRCAARGWASANGTTGIPANASSPLLNTVLPAELRPAQTHAIFPVNDSTKAPYRIQIDNLSGQMFAEAVAVPAGYWLCFDGLSWPLS